MSTTITEPIPLTLGTDAAVIASGTIAEICREAAEAGRLRRRLHRVLGEKARLERENAILAAGILEATHG
jgi:hypothetical protein